ncbi:MAG: aldehyde dehydrogenase family protein, partial [Bacteroidota bacterium]
MATKDDRVPVLKTHKMYIGGKFPRTESGRYYKLHNPEGALVANLCLASRKDVREAVVAARSAWGGWAARPAFNRGQIIYRLAEMIEARKATFADELQQMGVSAKDANEEVAATIDRVIHYAGWCDKYQQVFSTVNPVASSHFNFSLPEPMGVVAVVAPESSGLLGLVSHILPVIAGGNTVIALASNSLPLSAISLAEAIHTSDVPGGVINLLTGDAAELLPHLAGHMDINGVVYARDDHEQVALLQAEAAGNV